MASSSSSGNATSLWKVAQALGVFYQELAEPQALARIVA